jgi:hypothetical protein
MVMMFVATGDQLVPADTDDLRDVYDVRVDGGFPSSPSVPPACGSPDACRGPRTPISSSRSLS